MDIQLVLTALTSRTRARILALVSQRPMSLTELAQATGIGIPSVFVAVSILEQAGLVATKRRGRRRLVTSLFEKIDLQMKRMS
jgi:DNA-binding transcriptional ArsR family regulator